MKHYLFAGQVCILSLFALVAIAQNPHTDPNNTKAWILNTELSDEFDGTTLNEEKWLIQGRDGEYRSNFQGRAPWQYSTENVRLQNGKLILTTQYDPEHDWVDPGTETYKYTTAGINTKKSFQYGYIEIKCKLPQAKTVHAFWTTGAGGDPSELDVFEGIGKGARQSAMWSSIHDWSMPNPNVSWTNNKAGHTNLPFSLSDDFHVFAAEIDENSIKIYADGELITTTTRDWVEENGIDSKKWPMNSPQRVWVDSEVFPWWGEPDLADLPAEFEVEYVRVWQKASTNELAHGFFGFEEFYQFSDGSTENWWIPNNSRPNLQISSAHARDGNNALMFAHTEALANAHVAYAPKGSVQIGAGEYEYAMDVWLEEGSAIENIAVILDEPWVQTNFDLSTIEYGKWVRLTKTINRSEASGVDDRIRLKIATDDVNGTSSTMYIDNIQLKRKTGISNTKPFAQAGADQTVVPGTVVTLDATASSDPNNLPLTYSWTAPDGITLSDLTAAQATFTAPTVAAATTYTFSVVVSNGQENSVADQVEVTVRPAAPLGLDEGGMVRTQVYPNPASDFITIEAPTASQITLYGSTGAVVKQLTIRRPNINLSLEGLENGLYYLTISSTQGTKTLKVVKYGAGQ